MWMWGSTQNLVPIGSAVLTFIGYKKQINRKSERQAKYIYIIKQDIHIATDCNVQSRNLNKFCVKQNMMYNHIPLDQERKLPILHELLKVKEDNFVLNNFDDNEIATIINFLCSDQKLYLYIILYSCFCLIILYHFTFLYEINL